MKIIDRYIIQKFLMILVYTILAFIVIFIVVDLIEHLDKFLSYHAGYRQVALYYFYYIPFIIILTLPISMLLSSLFSLGSMAQYNEIIAIQTSGVSLYRILAPVLAIAFFISLLSGVVGETILPKTNRLRLDVYRYQIKKEVRQVKTARTQLAIEDTGHRQLFIQFYEVGRKRAHNVNILWVRGDKIIKRLDCRYMQWDSRHEMWKLLQVTERIFSDSSETVQQFDSLNYTDSHITPEDLVELEIQPEEMDYAQLKRFVNKMQALGADPRRWLVDLHMKISYPLASFIIVLFGAPLAARKRRSGPALGFALALLISFVYFLFLRSGQVLGHKGELAPWLAAWIGNIVFGIGGVMMMLRVRK